MRELYVLTATITLFTAACDGIPEGYRAAGPAIAEAEMFRDAARDCNTRTSHGRENCDRSIELRKKIRNTPTHFANRSEADRFFAISGEGNTFLLHRFANTLCREPSLSPNGIKLCDDFFGPDHRRYQLSSRT